MALTDVQIASQALVRLGALPISDFAEPTLEARTAAALYPTLRDALIAGHAWRFATAESLLEPDEEAPLAGFAHAFRLPADFLNALAVNGRRTRGWRIAAGRLHAEAAEVRLAYLYRAPEAEFPPWFVDALAGRLAAVFCLPVTENASRAEALSRLADMALSRARRADALHDPALPSGRGARMTRINTLKTGFGAGELSPRLAGRPDLAAYRDGARRLRNVIVHATGGLSRRPGLAFVEAVPGPGRLAAFDFNAEDSYLLLFADRTLRIYRDGVRMALVAAPWREADLAQLNWTQTADTLLVVHPDHPPQTVSRQADGAWRIAPWRWAERDGRSAQPYHRFAPASVTLTPSAATGRVRLTASAPVFAPADEGQLFRIGANEARIVRTVSATAADADVAGALAGGAAATPDWREPAFSPRRGWPVSAVFHQNRLVIGGSRALPDRLWLSRSGAFFDFDTGTGLDDEAIAFPLLADQANAVRAVMSGRHLQVFTSGAEWTVSGDPLTPATIQLRRQTRIGSPADRAVRPVDVEGAVLFLARGGRELREFLFADAELAYRAQDLALLAGHLFAAPVEQAWDAAARRLLVVMGDGSIAALTSWRAEGVHAWSRLETDGAFRSAAVAGGRAWVLVERGGRFSVERFDEALGVDAAMSGTLPEPARAWSGLAHLEGRRVAAVADGRALKGLAVAAGRILLDAPARTVQAGLPFTHAVEPLPPGVQLARGAIQGVAHRAVRVTLRLEGTSALCCDTGFGLRRQALGDEPFTGDVSLGAGGWRRDGAAPLWRIEDASPLPFHLLSAATELKVTDI